MTIGAIDIGNSAAKFGIFEAGTLVATFAEPLDRGTRAVSSSVVEALTEGGVERVGISSVVPAIRDAVDSGLRAKGVADIVHVSADSSLPFSIGYDTPSTLGVDRIAAAAGAHVVPEFPIAPDKPVAILDAGTALTIDVL
ncbi:MAG: type III pantothenate kinase, partial [Rhodothermales bacterium]|nr:type III pantothenate kinase [Rhodothermales bacterium]